MKSAQYLLKISVLALILIFNSKTSTIVSAQTTNYQAYSLFTYNFMKYIHWQQVSGNFTISVIGNSGVYEELLTTVQTKSVEGKKIDVMQSNYFDPAKAAQIIFISDNKSSMLKEIVEKTKGQGVLVITEREGLIDKGACISFVILDNGSLRFQINPGELKSRNIQMSNSLMAFAQN